MMSLTSKDTPINSGHTCTVSLQRSRRACPFSLGTTTTGLVALSMLTFRLHSMTQFSWKIICVKPSVGPTAGFSTPVVNVVDFFSPINSSAFFNNSTFQRSNGFTKTLHASRVRLYTYVWDCNLVLGVYVCWCLVSVHNSFGCGWSQHNLDKERDRCSGL